MQGKQTWLGKREQTLMTVYTRIDPPNPQRVFENRAMTASPGEDQAGRDSCSPARRQPAAARETGQGGLGRAQPPQAPSLSGERGSGRQLEAGFQAFTLC